MRTTYRHSGKQVGTFRQLINRYSSEEFDSPARSTVPSLAFWSDTDNRVKDLCKKISTSTPESCIMEFEYQVLTEQGKGKPSHTDLLISWDDTCVGIEAKYTEPPYETVNKWLVQGKDRQNREAVLSGWCNMISRVTGKAMSISAVGDATYQMIHRIASTCSRYESQKNVIYQVFNPSAETLNYYHTYLSRIRAIMEPTQSLRLFLWVIDIVPSDKYAQMINEWQRNQSLKYRVEVIRGLFDGNLMTFRERRFEKIE